MLQRTDLAAVVWVEVAGNFMLGNQQPRNSCTLHCLGWLTWLTVTWVSWNLDKNLICGRPVTRPNNLSEKELGLNVSVLSVTEFMLQCQYSVTNTSCRWDRTA